MIPIEDIERFEQRFKELKAEKKQKIDCFVCSGTGVITKKRSTKRDMFRRCSTCKGTGEMLSGVATARIIALSELFYLGYTRSEIRDMLIKRRHIQENTADFELTKAFAFIENEHAKKKNEVLAIHYKRYEKIYRKHAELDLEKVPKHLRGLRLFESLSVMIETLQSKERAFGIHSKNFMLKINQFNVQRRRVVTRNQYDFKKLELDELLKIKEIIDAAKKRSEAAIEINAEIASEYEFKKMTNTKHKKKEVVYDAPVQDMRTKKRKVEKEPEYVPLTTADDVKKKINDNLKASILKSMKKQKNGR